MVSNGRLGRSASTVIFWQWALGIGVGAACAGAVLVVGGQQAASRLAASTPPVATQPQPIEASGVASLGGTPLATAALDVPISADPPVVPLPLDKPILKPKSAVSTVFRARETTPSGVAHFDSCLPSCETRDPLVAGVAPPAPAPEPAPPVASSIPSGPLPPLPLLEATGGEPIPAPPPRGPLGVAVEGGKALVKGVETASGVVVRGTRRAVDTAVDLVW
ncbi:hypothetical protein [Pleomorphomonas sp. JP5]|uniref:hypothetical protein n=1 Tax=Pleomorphomonas sp. JP5 TaxID=2942998 RepID=UPI002044C178|nr:hypothetical protein [Pleomorphomonas sp. JP5]MCM5557318.1 hypothetical protein [Pleomorphomonas sp. JP5]